MGKRAQQKRKKKFRDFNYTELTGHKKEGNKLLPPFMQFGENLKTSSWVDDHLPPMLWAALLCSAFPRKEYLGCFRELITLAGPWFHEGGVAYVAPSASGNTGDELNFPAILDLETLAGLPDAEFDEFVKIILRHPLGQRALCPIALFDCIPGIARWRKYFHVEQTSEAWELLQNAVAITFDHQSEASTDIRWCKFMVGISSGRMKFPIEMAPRLEELRYFPDRGDMRSVRPFIRSGEMMMRRQEGASWVAAFWKECMSRTACIDPTQDEDGSHGPVLLDPSSLYTCREALIRRFTANISSQRTDSRLDSSFGLALYALSILEELDGGVLQEGIVGRLALRTVVEANITLRYLCKIDTEAMWNSWRVFGAGQAKLAFLKAQEVTGDMPPFIDEAALHAISNEDRWQEYLPIDLGHWAKTNLREMAQKCDAKETYDKYYSWSSTFAHSHWGAVRDTNFISCQNALHRLHRIPRMLHRRLTSVEHDIVELVNEMLEKVDTLYPGEQPIGRLHITPAPAKTTEDVVDASPEQASSP